MSSVNQSEYKESISIKCLHFDPDNPRLPNTVDGSNEQEVIDWMIKDATLVELMGSIGEQGYFPGEPLLAVSHKIKDNYIIVEGNRRLAAVKLLSNPEMATKKPIKIQMVAEEAKHKPQELPIFVYPTRDEILVYLGFRHITGVKAWESYAKARYAYQLFVLEDEGQSTKTKLREIAISIGSRADYVGRLVTGFSAVETLKENDFFSIEDLDENNMDFSLLTTAMNYKSIANFIGMEDGSNPDDANKINNDCFEELIKWLYEPTKRGKSIVGESRNIKTLAKIIEYGDQALQALRNGEMLEDAFKLTESPTQIFRSSISEARGNLRTANLNIYGLENPNEGDAETLREIQKTTRNLKTIIDESLEGSN
jgi:hypothetical protein